MIWALLIFGIITLDQYTKYLALTKLIKYDTLPIIENVFHLTFVKNKGAAFGILQEQRWFFVVVTIIIISGMVYYIIKYKPQNKLLLLSIFMVLGGAIGNFIDRVRFGYVVDFFDFTLINYPVFNIADSFVVIGTILMAYYIIFLYEDKKDKADV